MKSTVTIEELYQRLAEMTSAGVVDGGSGGFSPDSPFDKDSYAPDDMRTATPSKIIQKRSGAIKIKTNRRRKSKK